MKAGIQKNCLNKGTLNQYYLLLRTGLRQSCINAHFFQKYSKLGFKHSKDFLGFSILQLWVSLISKGATFKQRRKCVVFNSTITKILSNNFSNNSFNFFNACGPGIYVIICQVNNKRYIGEANNVLDRLGKHSRNLMNGESDCYELQKDWKKFGSNQFEAYVICIGPQWEDRNTRLKKEKEIISSYTPAEVYNVHPNAILEIKENYRNICEIKGIRYNSIAEASRMTGESETRIRTKLNNNFPGYRIMEKIKHGYEPIIANGKFYDSINDAVAHGEAIDRFQAIRRLKNPKYKNWNYQSPEKQIIK